MAFTLQAANLPTWPCDWIWPVTGIGDLQRSRFDLSMSAQMAFCLPTFQMAKHTHSNDVKSSRKEV